MYVSSCHMVIWLKQITRSTREIRRENIYGKCNFWERGHLVKFVSDPLFGGSSAYMSHNFLGRRRGNSPVYVTVRFFIITLQKRLKWEYRLGKARISQAEDPCWKFQVNAQCCNGNATSKKSIFQVSWFLCCESKVGLRPRKPAACPCP